MARAAKSSPVPSPMICAGPNKISLKAREMTIEGTEQSSLNDIMRIVRDDAGVNRLGFEQTRASRSAVSVPGA